MRNLILAVVLSLVSATAFAGNNGNGNGNGGSQSGGSVVGGIGGVAGGYIGTVGGDFSVDTNGGSMAQSGVYQNGQSFQYSSNAGTAWAGVGGDITNGGATGWTTGGSQSASYSVGSFEGNGGSFNNTTAGGVGNNYEASVEGSWDAAEVGGFVGIGAFGAFTGW